MKTSIKILISIILLCANYAAAALPTGDINDPFPLIDCSYTLIDLPLKNIDVNISSNDPVTRFNSLKTSLINKKNLTINGELDSVVTAYKSIQVGDKYFKGSFKCNDDYLMIAILSDDGVTVKLNGNDLVPKITKFHQGQALPNINDTPNSSLQLLEGVLTKGSINILEIAYSNVYYTQGNDIDGLTVFFCGNISFVPTISDLQLSFDKPIYPYLLTDQTCTATATVNYITVGTFNKTWDLTLTLPGGTVKTATVNYNSALNSGNAVFTGIPVPKRQGISDDYICSVDGTTISGKAKINVNETPTFTLSQTVKKVKSLDEVTEVVISTDVWPGTNGNIIESQQCLTPFLSDLTNAQIDMFDSLPEVIYNANLHNAITVIP